MAWSKFDIGCCCTQNNECLEWDDNFPTRQGSYNTWFDDFDEDTEAEYVYEEVTGTAADIAVTGGQLVIEMNPAGSGPYASEVRVWKHFHVPGTVASLTTRGKIGISTVPTGATLTQFQLRAGDYLQYPGTGIALQLSNTYGLSSAALITEYEIQALTSDTNTTGSLAISEDLEFEAILTNAGGDTYTAVMKAWNGGVLLATHTYATARTNTQILTAPDYGARRFITGCGFYILLNFLHSSSTSENPIIYLDDIEVDWTV